MEICRIKICRLDARTICLLRCRACQTKLMQQVQGRLSGLDGAIFQRRVQHQCMYLLCGEGQSSTTKRPPRSPAGSQAVCDSLARVPFASLPLLSTQVYTYRAIFAPLQNYITEYTPTAQTVYPQLPGATKAQCHHPCSEYLASTWSGSPTWQASGQRYQRSNHHARRLPLDRLEQSRTRCELGWCRARTTECAVPCPEGVPVLLAGVPRPTQGRFSTFTMAQHVTWPEWSPGCPARGRTGLQSQQRTSRQQSTDPAATTHRGSARSNLHPPFQSVHAAYTKLCRYMYIPVVVLR
ncbi:hypothetical protein SS50377_25212 [Spironucleus salmonicida]|uniref:Uncharacterized protein n=1 Tax=Spironucleus salmonicida TaxID=348837 RepID=V6LRE2_9EUKA|nr:hypothetical protein SS50377_25212 [Spironucleus salmonicida]|eukprot:EST46261.1 Hypothetical protein SS50377_13737 [Spironucleus salmonicida]